MLQSVQVFETYWVRKMLRRLVGKLNNPLKAENTKETEMKAVIAKFTRVLKLLAREQGQDMVEYALLIALIAFAATSGTKTLASKINTTFVNLGTTLTSDVA